MNTAAHENDPVADTGPGLPGSSRPAGNQTRGGNISALERASGRDWQNWLDVFAAAGAQRLDHAAIARVALAQMPSDLQNPDWWAQGAAIAYEQHIGLRIPGQSSTGTFRVSASRTLPLDRDAAIDAWVSAYGETTDHLGHACGAARPSRTDKRSFWRFSLDGAGRVEVSATPKATDRAVLAINHDGLPDAEQIEQWRAHWKQLLSTL